MKLLWCCIIATLTTTVAYAAVDVERTVQQVQNILKANAQLPRLTRDEILQLLHDIRAEDAKSSSTSTEQSKEIKKEETTTPYAAVEDNEISSGTLVHNVKENIVSDENDKAILASVTPKTIETTTKSEPNVMVVLPYTPRDGSSLQELYTRPPRVEVLPESKVTPSPLKPSNKLQETLQNNALLANKKKQSFPDELQAFLDAHGLKGNPGQDHFLLPLDGFKPLPPAKIIDGTVQLPENILLTYDLVPSGNTKGSSKDVQSLTQNNYLYEPLRPEIPFELDTSSSENEEIHLPYDLPKSRKTKSTDSKPKPNYEPIEYDSVKVIPLKQGPSPIEFDVASIDNDPNKRQANNSTSNSLSSTDAPSVSSEVNAAVETTSTDSKDSASTVDAVSSNTDTGASIADLEDSFGGAAPVEPGDSELPPPRKNGFYWMVDWNSFLEVGDGDTKVNIRFEPKLGDPQMFLPVNVP